MCEQRKRVLGGWACWLVFGGVLLAVMTTGRPSKAQDSPSTETEASEDVDAVEEEPLDNRLKWSTASEVDNFGYDVYRGDSEDGPFDRITEDPLPGRGTTDEPSYYEYADRDIDPSRDYYYYVESIALDGTRERFTPVIRAKAKRPVTEAEADTGHQPEAGEGEQLDAGPVDDSSESAEPISF